jgi:hypothetical protein
MPLGLGIAKGVSYVNDWEKDIDRTYQRAEYAARIQQEKERKTAYYAELLKKGHATNPRAEGELNEFYKSLNGELATFVTENPNFETDIDAMQKFNDIKDKYLNNDILRKDIQVGKEMEKLRSAVSQGTLTKDEYEAEAKRYDDYINKKSDEPYVFTNFNEVDLDKLASEAARSVGDVTLDGSEDAFGKLPDTKKLDPRTQDWTVDVGADPRKLRMVAEETYADPKKNIAIQKRFSDVMKNPLNAELYKGPDAAKDWWYDFMKAHSDMKRTNMGQDYYAQKALRGEHDVNTDYAYDGKVKRLLSLASTKDADGNYVDGAKDPSTEADTNLTDWGSEAKSIVTNNMNAKVIVDGQYKSFTLKKGLSAREISTGDWVIIAGVPHLELNIEVENPRADAEYHNDLKGQLNKYGFIQEEAIVGMGMDMNSKQINGLKHTGKILIPIKLSPEKMVNWTRQYGQKAVDYVAPIYEKKREEISGINAENELKLQTWNLSHNNANSQLVDKIYNERGVKLENEVGVMELGNNAPYEKGRYFYTTRQGVRYIYDVKTGQAAPKPVI